MKKVKKRAETRPKSKNKSRCIRAASPPATKRRRHAPQPKASLARKVNTSGDPAMEPAQSSPADFPRSDALHLYLREIGQVKLLTPKEEITLAGRIKRGDKQAREHMIKANLRLVVKIARDYDGLGLPLLDLINEGNIGLMKGVERFDPKKGAKLSTYAAWWIKQNIKRALANQSKTIRLPVHVVDKVAHLRRAERKLRETFDRDPTDEELAEELQMDPRRVQQYREASKAPVSLDASIGNDDESNRIADVVADPNAAAPFDQLVRETDTELVREVLSTLSEREISILSRRYGLKDGTPRTLEEIGAQFGLTRERIRQIQEEALKKLRVKMEKRDRPAMDETLSVAIAA